MPDILRAAPLVGFINRYPEGHELAGQMIERMGVCPSCGKEFLQRQVNNEWIGGTHVEMQDAFLDTVEVDAGGVFQPLICHPCARDARNA